MEENSVSLFFDVNPQLIASVLQNSIYLVQQVWYSQPKCTNTSVHNRTTTAIYKTCLYRLPISSWTLRSRAAAEPQRLEKRNFGRKMMFRRLF